MRHLGRGIVGATFAGVVSALLGIGGGIIKVPLMNLSMGVPLRVATATSNMMIGITASASAVIYLIRGGIDPYVAGPTAIGVFVGATVGSRLAHRVDLRAAAPAVRGRPRLHGHPDAAASPRVSAISPRAYAAERTIGRLLIGVTYVSVGLLVIGVRPDDRERHLAARPGPPLDLATLGAQLVALDPAGFLWLGLLAVIAAPIGRVIVAAVVYAARRRLDDGRDLRGDPGGHRHRRRDRHRCYRLGRWTSSS